jgi:WD40 repeat protein
MVMEGHTEQVNSVAFSNDNKLVASGSDDYSVIIWNSADGNKVKKLTIFIIYQVFNILKIKIFFF